MIWDRSGGKHAKQMHKEGYYLKLTLKPLLLCMADELKFQRLANFCSSRVASEL